MAVAIDRAMSTWRRKLCCGFLVWVGLFGVGKAESADPFRVLVENGGLELDLGTGSQDAFIRYLDRIGWLPKNDHSIAVGDVMAGIVLDPTSKRFLRISGHITAIDPSDSSPKHIQVIYGQNARGAKTAWIDVRVSALRFHRFPVLPAEERDYRKMPKGDLEILLKALHGFLGDLEDIRKKSEARIGSVEPDVEVMTHITRSKINFLTAIRDRVSYRPPQLGPSAYQREMKRLKGGIEELMKNGGVIGFDGGRNPTERGRAELALFESKFVNTSGSEARWSPVYDLKTSGLADVVAVAGYDLRLGKWVGAVGRIERFEKKGNELEAIRVAVFDHSVPAKLERAEMVAELVLRADDLRMLKRYPGALPGSVILGGSEGERGGIEDPREELAERLTTLELEVEQLENEKETAEKWEASEIDQDIKSRRELKLSIEKRLDALEEEFLRKGLVEIELNEVRPEIRKAFLTLFDVEAPPNAGKGALSEPKSAEGFVIRRPVPEDFQVAASDMGGRPGESDWALVLEDGGKWGERDYSSRGYNLDHLAGEERPIQGVTYESTSGGKRILVVFRGYVSWVDTSNATMAVWTANRQTSETILVNLDKLHLFVHRSDFSEALKVPRAVEPRRVGALAEASRAGLSGRKAVEVHLRDEGGLVSERERGARTDALAEGTRGEVLRMLREIFSSESARRSRGRPRGR